MSSSAPGGSDPPGDKPQGFSRFMRRASKVLKRGSSTRGSTSGTAEAQPSSSRSTAPVESDAAPLASLPAPVVPPKTEPQAVPSVPAAIRQSIKDTKPSTSPQTPRLVTTAAASSAIQEEKARALFAKYGLTLEAGEWTPPFRGDAERVEKKVRMRVHRTCHRCSTSFGAEKICGSCQHTRCKKCPRYPVKKSKEQKAKGKGVGTGASAIAIDDVAKAKSSSGIKPLTMPHRITGKELTRRVPLQRVRRTCHKCEALFIGKATQCVTCKHLRCPKCPREPPKLSKHPDGYPGDTEETFPLARRELRAIRTHVRWTCHSCQTVFKDLEKTCRNCAHERCDNCTREPPKTEEEPLDEAAIESVAEKMKRIEISPQASAA